MTTFTLAAPRPKNHAEYISDYALVIRQEAVREVVQWLRNWDSTVQGEPIYAYAQRATAAILALDLEIGLNGVVHETP